jgi:hypothetical protein
MVSHHLDEVIFEVIEDNIIEVIEQSKLILIDK